MSSHDKRFLECVAISLDYEGGFSDDPDDAGGPTNLGITQATLDEAFRRGIVTTMDVKSLTRDDALRIYYELYWLPAHCSEFPEPLDACLFDMAINSGFAQAVRNLQEVLNDLLQGEISVDGAFGPRSRGALETALEGLTSTVLRPAAEIVARIYQHERAEFYDEITDGVAGTEKRRSQELRNRKFFRGWNHLRVHKLEQDIGLR